MKNQKIKGSILFFLYLETRGHKK